MAARPELSAALGPEFANGHDAATGGSVPPDAFRQLLEALSFDEAGLKGGKGSRGSNKRRQEEDADDTDDGSQGAGSSSGGGMKQLKMSAFLKPRTAADAGKRPATP